MTFTLWSQSDYFGQDKCQKRKAGEKSSLWLCDTVVPKLKELTLGLWLFFTDTMVYVSAVSANSNWTRTSLEIQRQDPPAGVSEPRHHRVFQWSLFFFIPHLLKMFDLLWEKVMRGVTSSSMASPDWLQPVTSSTAASRQWTVDVHMLTASSHTDTKGLAVVLF